MPNEAFEKNGLVFRPAMQNDLPKILAFADIFLRKSWLVRRDYANDHIAHSWIVLDHDKLVGWAMMAGKRVGKSLYNLIVHPKYRNRHIGMILIEALNPEVIRCKTDQSTGDPTAFYVKMGYRVTEIRQGKNKKIKIMRKSKPIPEHQEDDDSV